jgi:hypothetical protein
VNDAAADDDPDDLDLSAEGPATSAKRPLVDEAARDQTARVGAPLAKITASSRVAQTNAAATLAQINFSALLPKIDTTALLRQAGLVPALAQIDTAALVRQTNLAESLARFDTPVAWAAHLDFAAPLPTLDVSRLLPDVSRLLPNVVAGLVPLSDVAALLPRLQLPDFADLLEQLRRDEPPNWPDDIELDRVTEVIRDDGIPLVWVPRATVVTEVLAAPDRPARAWPSWSSTWTRSSRTVRRY